MALFSYGFRPFFLVAGAYAALVVPVTLAIYHGHATEPSAWPLGLWHGHELLFGYAAAVVAGFLLTAVPGWQKTRPVAGVRLALLVAVWLAGRVAMWSAGLIPAWLVAALDLAFLPTLLLVGVPSLWRARARRNRVFLVILGLLVAANALMHAAGQGLVAPRAGIVLALDTFALLIAILGGRVVPAFTTNALASQGRRDAVRPSPFRDRLALASIAATLIADLAARFNPAVMPVVGVLAFAAAIANAGRMAGWGTRYTFDKPIVWILHLAYAWLIAGFAAKGLAAFDLLDPALAAHALAVGAIGSMTLAVMSRAGLGHTGRPLVAPPAIVAAYGLVSLAAVARIAGGGAGLVVAAIAWTAAYVAFTVTFLPILTRSRPDSRSG